jgi:hypothetical protein
MSTPSESSKKHFEIFAFFRAYLQKIDFFIEIFLLGPQKSYFEFEVEILKNALSLLFLFV